MDPHAEHEVGIAAHRSHGLRLALRVEGDPGLQPVLARCADRGGDVAHRLVVEGDAVAARCRDRLEVLGGALDHQVHVDRTPVAVDQRRDRREDDRAHRDRLDEVAVADVEMEDAAFGREQLFDLVAEVGEVRPVERRLDLDRPDPIPPGHPFDPTVSTER